jgi:hypothetical protein
MSLVLTNGQELILAEQQHLPKQVLLLTVQKEGVYKAEASVATATVTGEIKIHNLR